MKTLEQVKKNKNYMANSKGYPIDPEGFSYNFLIKRFYDELIELTEATTQDKVINDVSILLPESQWYCNDSIMDELADLSNIIDYIATKIITGYPTIHKDTEQSD